MFLNDPDSNDALTRKGLIHGYVSDIRMAPGHSDEYDVLTIADATTGSTLFTLNAREGAGDYRGYPANIHAIPALELPEMYHDIASRREDDYEHDPDFHDTFHELVEEYRTEEEDAFQFLLRDRNDGDGWQRYEFVAWLPTSSDFDLEEEIANRVD